MFFQFFIVTEWTMGAKAEQTECRIVLQFVYGISFLPTDFYNKTRNYYRSVIGGFQAIWLQRVLKEAKLPNAKSWKVLFS